MNKKKDYTLLLVMIVIAIAILCSCNGTPKSYTHTCNDQTHLSCDGGCECDGLGCNISGVTYGADGKPITVLAPIALHQYQLCLVEDTVIVYDAGRFVGKIPLWDNSPLDKLIQLDNE